MPVYEILELPGKERIFPGEDDQPPRTQDEAKIIVQRLRAEAKVEGRQVDFVIKPMGKEVGTSNGSAATSVRLTEDNRRKVARFCGRIMMQTGDALSMGDAVARLVDLADAVQDLLDDEGRLSDDKILAAARVIRLARKAEEVSA